MGEQSPITIARMWAKVNIPTAPRSDGMCWMWTGSVAKGYGQIKSGDKVLRVHRVAYEFAHGPLDAEAHVMHTCDTPLCCNPAHLKAGTRAENMADMAQKGRAYKGGPRPK